MRHVDQDAAVHIDIHRVRDRDGRALHGRRDCRRVDHAVHRQRRHVPGARRVHHLVGVQHDGQARARPRPRDGRVGERRGGHRCCAPGGAVVQRDQAGRAQHLAHRHDPLLFGLGGTHDGGRHLHPALPGLHAARPQATARAHAPQERRRRQRRAADLHVHPRQGVGLGAGRVHARRVALLGRPEAVARLWTARLLAQLHPQHRHVHRRLLADAAHRARPVLWARDDRGCLLWATHDGLHLQGRGRAHRHRRRRQPTARRRAARHHDVGLGLGLDGHGARRADDRRLPPLPRRDAAPAHALRGRRHVGHAPRAVQAH
mmetsp:Transcript_1014/g.2631  ORF Transcript_1014/g.2631 Transcript_1014/m.2631 type:complete len:317 (+) Transcript_1014:363-1313(+)